MVFSRFCSKGIKFVRISKVVLQSINQVISDTPPETGGILGSRIRNVVDNVVFDLPSVENVRPCVYFPNVDFLNHIIRLWQKNGIRFVGIFHTHFAGVKTLSSGDIKYIHEIMQSMPSSIEYLYFPVFVLPDRELVCYKAIRTKGTVDIAREPTVIE